MLASTVCQFISRLHDPLHIVHSCNPGQSYAFLSAQRPSHIAATDISNTDPIPLPTNNNYVPLVSDEKDCCELSDLPGQQVLHGYTQSGLSSRGQPTVRQWHVGSISLTTHRVVNSSFGETTSDARADTTPPAPRAVVATATTLAALIPSSVRSAGALSLRYKRWTDTLSQNTFPSVVPRDVPNRPPPVPR